MCLTPRIAMGPICLPHTGSPPLPTTPHCLCSGMKEKLNCLRLDIWFKTRIPTWRLEGAWTAVGFKEPCSVVETLRVFVPFNVIWNVVEFKPTGFPEAKTNLILGDF